MSAKSFLLSLVSPLSLVILFRHRHQCLSFTVIQSSRTNPNTLGLRRFTSSLPRHRSYLASYPQLPGSAALGWCKQSGESFAKASLIRGSERGVMPSFLERSKHERSQLPLTMTSATTLAASVSEAVERGGRSVNWPLWYILPIAPYQRRKTIMKEIIPDKVWTFDQVQGILYVIVPVRMTVIKLENTEGGGLFVYAPVAPTAECLGMIRELEAEHGPVRHIVLGTLGLEHKVFAGPFSQRFPESRVWYTPGQYSFPIKLPLSWLGFGGRPTQPIPNSSKDAPWSADLDHAVLGPFFSKDGSGGYGETAFFHKSSQSLLVTDMVVKVEDEVPEIVAEDPRPLLFHARDNAKQKVEDTKEVRRKGWRRIVQFALTFQPSSLEVVDIKTALFEDAPQSKMKELGWGGLFPFKWNSPSGDTKSFEAFKGGLLVAPILQILLLNRDPIPVLDWADQVASWPFKRVIPCHLANDVAATPEEFRRAFAFLEKQGTNGGFASLFQGWGRPKTRGAQPLPEDLQFLRDAEETLVQAGTLFPAAEPVDRSWR